MKRKTEFYLEMKKLRHRHIPLLFLLTFAVIALWMGWCLKDLNLSKTNDMSAVIYLNLLLMNTILCPLLFAATASRMCDMEQLGDTYKWLCTLQKPEHIYRGKVMAGCFYLLLFTLMQVLLFVLLSFRLSLAGAASASHPYLPLNLFVSLFFSSACIFILQLNLSIRFTNQLTPVFISIGGTFAGLFSWFLSQWPLRYLIPWGYYAVLCSTGYWYDEQSRYTTYFWETYPFFWMLVLAAAILTLYRHGQKSFLRIVRESI